MPHEPQKDINQSLGSFDSFSDNKIPLGEEEKPFNIEIPSCK